MTPERIEQLYALLKRANFSPQLFPDEEVEALRDLALKGLQAEARNSPKCEDCGFRMARGDSDRSGQEWWCPVCATAIRALAPGRQNAAPQDGDTLPSAEPAKRPEGIAGPSQIVDAGPAVAAPDDEKFLA